MAKFDFGVGFASTDWSRVDDAIAPNGCTWYRCMLPANEIVKRRGSASVGFFARRPNGMIAIKSPNDSKPKTFGVIVLKVIMHREALNSIETAQALGQKIVVDIDDLFDEIHETNMAHGSTDKNKNRDNNREIYKQIMTLSDALICSTPFIADYYRQEFPNKPIYVIRNAIDIKRWTYLKAVDRTPIIGWLGATPWRSLDLEQLSGFFGKYIEKHKYKFHHAGHLPWAPPAYLKLGIKDKSLLTASPMVPLYELPRVYANFDIGIVPLNDIPFNRAKSFIKGLEYAAAGIPFVASALPEYEYLADAGVGRVARNEKEWMRNLDELADYSMRMDESLYNRKLVEEKFSIDSTADEWIRVFKEIASL